MNYTEICAALKNAGIAEYRYEATLLLSHFCGVSPERIPFCRQTEFDSAELATAVAVRCTRYPLQYILGEWHFCNEVYKIGRGCLIPRQETEQLVLTAAELLPQGAEFLDLCTGSGCIAVSLLCARPDCTAVAADISFEALEYARENADRNGVSDRLKFVSYDILLPDAPEKICGDKCFQAIISNPPYIPSEDVDGLAPELAFEPRTALDGGNDGLMFYRAIVSSFGDCLDKNGFIMFEAGCYQKDDLEKIAGLNGFSFTAGYDAAGLFRTALYKNKLQL